MIRVHLKQIHLQLFDKNALHITMNTITKIKILSLLNLRNLNWAKNDKHPSHDDRMKSLHS